MALCSAMYAHTPGPSHLILGQKIFWRHSLEVPALHGTLIPCVVELSRISSQVIQQAEGMSAGCSRWERLVLFPKLHSLVTVKVSAKNLPRKRGPQQSLLAAASRPLHRTQVWQSRFTNCQRPDNALSKLVCNNKRAHP